MDEEQPGSFEKQLNELRERVARLEAALRENRTFVAPTDLSSAQPMPQAPQPLGEAPQRPFLKQRANPHDRSLESRIGSQWFNRIGILAVLIGMAWFLKLAIDNHWIGPAARVLIGIIAGVALIIWSERFRTRGFTGFAYSLKAVGSGILYLSIWAAYSLFHLLPAPAAFVAMLAVTAFNGFMAWSQDSELLALYALIGGYITPLLLTSGKNHEVALFSYLLLLNLATLMLAIVRPWSRLLAVAFAGSLFYFVLWSTSFYSGAQFAPTVFFLSIYFLLFAFSPRLIRAAETPSTPVPRDIFALRILPFANAALSFLGFYLLLDVPGGDWTQSWVAAIFAVFYFVAMMLPTQFIHAPHSTSRTPLRSFDLLIAVAFLAFAVGRAIHHYWWSIRFHGSPATVHNIAIYAQFTYSTCFMLFGAALLTVGFTRRAPFLRWQALVMLAITIGKVFLVDITQLSQAWRVLSFLGLGALLLAISFLYQKDWLGLRRNPK